MSWQDQAACREHPDLPWDTRGSSSAPVKAALLVCSACPVRRDCLADADRIETDFTTHGIRGGLTQSERAARRAWRSDQSASSPAAGA